MAVKNQTFLLGPAFCAGFGNGLLLGYLMYRSRLVPRPMVNFLFTLPEIVWEAALGIWLTVKGFRPAPVLGGQALTSS